MKRKKLDRGKVIALIVRNESVALEQLPAPASGQRVAWSTNVLSRELLGAVMTPPTRHKSFVVVTRWEYQSDGVFRALDYVLCAVDSRYRFLPTETRGSGKFTDSLAIS